MEFFLIYLFTVATKATGLAQGYLIVLAIVVAIAAIFGGLAVLLEEWSKGPELAATAYKWLKVPTLIAALIFLLTPSKEDIYFIAGGGLSLMAAQNEEVQKMPINAAKAVNRFLERLEPVKEAKP